MSPALIEDYALVGDCHTAALISRWGSVDWLCLPRFDDQALFAALVGTKDHGHWLLQPVDESATPQRRYDGDTFILLTTWETPTGSVEVMDFMPYGDHRANLVRRVRGLTGVVAMREELRLRFGYGSQIPWIRQIGTEDAPAMLATAGPNSIVLRGPRLHAKDHVHTAEFEVRAGETVDIPMTWYPSHRDVPTPANIDVSLSRTREWWSKWTRTDQLGDQYADAVKRSLLILRALTHEDTGGVAAAATTSLPEQFGGPRNWDYRYVWLRDASLTLAALIAHGYREEARAWRGWLLRAIAGDPSDVQIMYGLAGERYLPERELADLPGYDGASPVRVGNEAYLQYQGDVFGEVLAALDDARQLGLQDPPESWALQRALLGRLEDTWQQKDHGIWEIRGPLRAFTQSRAMIWAAFDRGVRAVEERGFDGPVERWRKLRDAVREEIFAKGWNEKRQTFVQYYGSTEVDASLLTLPQFGFIDCNDPRMLGTVAAIEEDLLDEKTGLVLRYRPESGVDGLPGTENAFLACAFWLVEQYAMSGRITDAQHRMDQLLAYRNDVGMLSEEVDPSNGRHAGNTPQAFSHLALINAADAINRATHGASQPRARMRASDARTKR